MFEHLTFADRQQEIWVPWMKFELIDGISMSYIVLDNNKVLYYITVFDLSRQIKT